MSAATTAVPPRVCPRCARPLIRNHDRGECLVHGEIDGGRVMAHERVALSDKGKPARAGSPVPWTDEERDLWRRELAGEPVPDPWPTERERRTMDEPDDGLARVVIRRAEDLAAPVVARLTDMAQRKAAAEAALAAMAEEMGRLLAVADLLGAIVPEAVRTAARGGARKGRDE